jgi:hypothetical protein
MALIFHHFSTIDERILALYKAVDQLLFWRNANANKKEAIFCYL